MPHANSTSKFYSMIARGPVLRMALAGLLLLLPVGTLGYSAASSDEVSLLQAEVLTKARAAGQRPEQGDSETRPSCQAFATDAPMPIGASCGLCDPAKAPRPRERAAPERGSPANSDRGDRGLLLEAEASPTLLGLVLEVLAVALLLDGVRRSRAKPRGEERAQEQARRIVRPSAEFDELMRAALAGNAEICGRLLEGVSRVVGEDVWGCTALHAAAKGGSADVARRLLGLGASVHSCDAWDETPLHIAARAGVPDVCDLLLAHGASVDAINAQDWTPLVVAADAGHRPTCELLLAKGAGTAGLPDKDLPRLLAKLGEQWAAAGEAEKDVSVNPFEDMEELYGGFGGRWDSDDIDGRRGGGCGDSP
mmetsp:Transcript_49550/g.146391  ORF Transcript_49550/g.146391 Transcript_49550/m.146391 type:complete len:366 (+) Transcript_49550:30-1127(+)